MKNEQKYVIGVDGGGTKTVAALANLTGQILKTAKSGSSSPRNAGIRKAAENVVKAIRGVLQNKKNIKIASVFIGLPAVAEEFKSKKETIKKEISREISDVFDGKVKIGSDQIVAFRSGTDEKEGMVLIAGTGCVAHGWKSKNESHCSGRGWLADEGSAFWVGQKVYQAVLKDLDGRGAKTLLTKKVFQEFKIKKAEDLLNLVYVKNPTEIIPKFSIICDKISKKGDEIAKNIMVEAGKELALNAKTIIKKLNFQKEKLPLVLIGGMFKSKIVLNTVKKEIRKFSPKIQFIQPKKEPVAGAVKLAIEL